MNRLFAYLLIITFFFLFSCGRVVQRQAATTTTTTTSTTTTTRTPSVLAINGLAWNDINQLNDQSLLMAVGNLGVIVKSTDEGASWQTLVSPAEVSWKFSTAFDEDRVFIGGNAGSLYYSTDGGATWLATAFNGRVTSALNAGKASMGGDLLLVVGDNGVLFRSTDSGVTFSQIDLTGITTADLRGVDIDNDVFSVAYACGTGGLVIRSIDSGETWSVFDLGITNDLNCIRSVDNGNIILGGGDDGTMFGRDIHDPGLGGAFPNLLTNADILSWWDFTVVGLNGFISILSPEALYTQGMFSPVNWTALTPSGLNGRNINKVIEVNNDTAYFAGEDNLIFKATTAQRNWQQVYP